MRPLLVLTLTPLVALGCGKKSNDSSSSTTGSSGSSESSGSSSGSGGSGSGGGEAKSGVRASLRSGPSGENFTPSKEGFSFQNYGNEEGIENLTAGELQRLFGKDVCAEGEGESCVLTPPAQRWMEETNKGMNGGHCEGMATVALLLELGKLKPTDFGAESTYKIEFKDNKKLQHEIAMWFSTQAIAPMSAAEVRTMTPNQIADTLAEAFKSGKESYTLGFYMADGSGGHATTPYAVVDKSPDETWIMHYDNNFPGEERHITINRKANTWTYFTAADPKEPGATYEGNADTKSLTIAPTSVRTGKLVCPFCGDVDKGAGGSREIITDGDADVLVTDDKGKRIGHADGKLVNEVEGGEVVEPKSTGRAATSEPIYRLPQGHALTVTLDGGPLKKKEATDVSLIAPGYTMGVYGVDLSPGEKDTLTFSPDWKEVSYQTEHDETPELELGVETSGADYEFEIHAGGEAGGQRVDLTLDVTTGTLTVQAAAKDGAASYEVEIHRIDEHGDQVFKHKGVSSGAADKLVFHYGDWKGNGSAMKAGVDKGGDGKVDEDEDLADEE